VTGLRTSLSVDGKTIVFLCHKCGREQAYASEENPGGVTHQEAKNFGWKVTTRHWPRTVETQLCPFCEP